MMEDKHPFAPAPAEAERSAPEAQAETPAGSTAPPTAASAAVLKFKSCRWRCDPDAGEFCTHRDVLPFAGKEGFNAESWCPDCEYYKLRRTPRKRERVDYSY
jgi:hypothetical protein